jgi:hypothetical protein
MNAHTRKADQDFLDHIVDNMGYFEGQDFDDLHHFLFNEDYYIIGYYQAEKWIKDNDLNTFDLIKYCQEQEENNFGQISTTFDNAEKLVNHYAYWRGQELLWKVQAIWDFTGQTITEELIKEVKEELK